MNCYLVKRPFLSNESIFCDDNVEELLDIIRSELQDDKNLDHGPIVIERHNLPNLKKEDLNEFQGW